MAKLVVHGGDFLPSNFCSFTFGKFTLKTPKHWIFGEQVAGHHLRDVRVVTQESPTSAMVGFAVGGLGMAVGKRKSEVTFAAAFADGRRFVGTTDGRTFRKILGLAMTAAARQHANELASTQISASIEFDERTSEAHADGAISRWLKGREASAGADSTPRGATSNDRPTRTFGKRL